MRIYIIDFENENQTLRRIVTTSNKWINDEKANSLRFIVLIFCFMVDFAKRL